MTEADYIAAIRASAPEGREIPPESLELVERALLEHPNSSQLWLKNDIPRQSLSATLPKREG